MITVDELLKIAKQKPDNVLAVFCYGSRVYGTHSPSSDFDYLMVVKHLPQANGNELGSDQLTHKNITVNVYTQEHFQNHIKEQRITALECYFLPQQFVLLKKYDIKWVYDEAQLRSSISAKADNSWVKAKKKLTVEKDYDSYTAKKSLFHALRMLMFGIQIAKNKKITNYQEANPYWEQIKNDPETDWTHYQELYQKEYNRLKSEFRTVAKKN